MVWLPLVLLAIPSVVIGFMTIEPLLFGTWFGNAIVINATAHPAMEELAREFHGLRTIRRLPYHFQIRLVIKDDRQAGANDILIVGE